MTAYKAKQNKALRKGWHISYGVADGEVWTTNGFVAVRKKVTPAECKALKEQHDMRGEQALDMQPLFDAYQANPTWPASVGKTEDEVVLAVRDKRLKIDEDLFDYVEALYPNGNWFVTEGKVQDYAQYRTDKLVAMLAPIIKDES